MPEELLEPAAEPVDHGLLERAWCAALWCGMWSMRGNDAS